LPDGIFADQKYQFLYIFEAQGMENFGICYTLWYSSGRLVYTLYGYLVDFVVICCVGPYFPILVCCTKKNLATLMEIGRLGQRTLGRPENEVQLFAIFFHACQP
jgi:hypothetical protein